MSQHQGPLNEEEIQEFFRLFPEAPALIGLQPLGPESPALNRQDGLTSEQRFERAKHLDSQVFGTSKSD